METTTQKELVLVTGASGYIGSRLVLTLLDNGYSVRGTVRSKVRGDELLQTLSLHTDRLDQVELVAADLLADEGWDEAVRGCTYVHHTASPFPLETPETEDDLIRPAVEGTRRALAAAARNGVKRVVLTSSTASVASGHLDADQIFTEADWSNLDGEIQAYPKSKTLAEKTAWEFVAKLPSEQSLELAVINPSLVIGPVIDSREKTSNALLLMLLNGEVPGVTRLKFNLVDVRDVALAHIAAMETSSAKGERFLCVAGGLWLPEIVKILANHFGPRGYRIPGIVLPDWLVRLYALFDRSVRAVLPDLGKDSGFDTSHIRQELNWQPRPIEQSLIEMGESLIEQGLVKPT